MDTNGRQHAVVLVADHEESVLKAVSSTLEKAGYTVIAARGKSAVSDMCRRGEQAQLAILDSAMPGTEIEELVNRLSQCNPGIPILLTSNEDEAGLGAPLGKPGQVRGFIRKPFRRSQLLGRVLNVLDQPLVLTA